MGIKLENAPLLECAFELHWKLTPSWISSTGINATQIPLPPGAPAPFQTDPFYRIFLARMSDKLQLDYPNYVALPQSNMPDEVVPHLVQHRFQSQDKLPLVQIGPGVLSINHGPNYSWEDFKHRINNVIAMFYESYPKRESLALENVSLRYINGFALNEDMQDALLFIKENLSVSFSVPKSVFGAHVTDRVRELNMQLTFPTNEPEGVLNSSWATGMHEQQRKLIWQSTIVSPGGNVDFDKDSDSWLESAHNIIDRWFFESLSGQLRGALLHDE